MRKPVVALDWDGTLVKQEWPARTRNWQPGAVEALRELSKFARVIVHTSRIAPMETDLFTPKPPHLVEEEIEYIRSMLRTAGVEAEVWDFRAKPWKPSADAYVDDKAVWYSGRPQSWKHLTRKLAVMCGQDYEEEDGDV